MVVGRVLFGICGAGLVQLSVLFFFKQKTAYEILTCDWSSDVCSSDLVRRYKCVTEKGSAKNYVNVIFTTTFMDLFTIECVNNLLNM